METERKTGLGNSLLLQRTDVPAEVAPTESSNVQTSGFTLPSEEKPTSAAKEKPESPSSRPVSRKKRKVQVELRDRCTLYLERAINEQLHLAARIEGRERSDIVTEILRKYLTKYRVEREE